MTCDLTSERRYAVSVLDKGLKADAALTYNAPSWVVVVSVDADAAAAAALEYLSGSAVEGEGVSRWNAASLSTVQ